MRGYATVLHNTDRTTRRYAPTYRHIDNHTPPVTNAHRLLRAGSGIGSLPPVAVTVHTEDSQCVEVAPARWLGTWRRDVTCVVGEPVHTLPALLDSWAARPRDQHAVRV